MPVLSTTPGPVSNPQIGDAVVRNVGQATFSSHVAAERPGGAGAPEGWHGAGYVQAAPITVLIIILIRVIFLKALAVMLPSRHPTTSEPSAGHCITPVWLTTLTLFQQSSELGSREHKVWPSGNTKPVTFAGSLQPLWLPVPLTVLGLLDNSGHPDPEGRGHRAQLCDRTLPAARL